ncbi:hypothetical protein BMA10399_E1396 [Burkholderia mallei ATCC 10399]|nr:hypothetical protein BMA10399_E1396 [Burkholderia mallei ATCC 10399]
MIGAVRRRPCTRCRAWRGECKTGRFGAPRLLTNPRQAGVFCFLMA